jgi:hypothetical protein
MAKMEIALIGSDGCPQGDQDDGKRQELKTREY